MSASRRTYGWRVCSFHDADGEGTDINGRKWRWEFSRQFGPLFIDPRGKPLKVQPVSEKHPVWPVFERWYSAWKAQQGNSTCEHAPPHK